MSKNEQLLGEILVDNLPKRTLGALRVMARLKYPIKDQRSFVAQLEALLKDPQISLTSEEEKALPLVRSEINPLDFPIETPVSGLEKGLARFSESFWDDFRTYLPFLGGEDSLEHPTVDARRSYQEAFSPVCAERAYNHYLRVKPPAYDPYDPYGEIRAFVAGMFEGSRCMHYGP